MTRWTNTKIVGPKKCLVQKYLGEKFAPKKIFGKKYLGSKVDLGPGKFGGGTLSKNMLFEKKWDKKNCS